MRGNFLATISKNRRLKPWLIAVRLFLVISLALWSLGPAIGSAAAEEQPSATQATEAAPSAEQPTTAPTTATTSVQEQPTTPPQAETPSNSLENTSSQPQALNPYIATDKADYFPGESVIITGGGFAPGEPVKIVIVNADQVVVHDNTVTAGQDGSIYDIFLVPPFTAASAAYTVTATGQISGVQATTSFTDSVGFDYYGWDKGDAQHTAQGWQKGNIIRWKEGEWIPYMLVLTNGTDQPQSSPAMWLTYDHYNSQNDAIGFDDQTGWNWKNWTSTPDNQIPNAIPQDQNGTPITPGATFVAPFTTTPYPPSSTQQTLATYFPAGAFTVPPKDGNKDGKIAVQWLSHLSVTAYWRSQSPPHYGSSYYPGASLHVHLQVQGVGQKDVPTPVPPKPTGSISGYKYKDTLGGQKLDGWTITLSGTANVGGDTWPVNLTATTGQGYYANGSPWPSGYYEFPNLVEGNYTVTETLLNGWMNITPGNSPPSYSYPSFAEGQIVTDDFVNSEIPQTGTISGMKFEDVDGDHVKDTGEPGLSGWTIFLDANDNGQLDQGELSTTTGDGTTWPLGYYEFTDVPAGSYTVREILQNGWTQTYPTTDNGTYPITVVGGGTYPDKDFGNFKNYKKTFSLTVNPPIDGASYFVDYSTDNWQTSATLPLTQIGQTNVFTGEVNFSSVPLTLVYQWRAEIGGQTVWQSAVEQEIWSEVGEDRLNEYTLNYALDIDPPSATNAVGESHQFTVTVTEVGTGAPLEGVTVYLSTDFGTLSASSVTTDSNGEATFSISSDQAGTAHITAWIDALGGTSATFDQGEVNDTASKTWEEYKKTFSLTVNPPIAGATYFVDYSTDGWQSSTTLPLSQVGQTNVFSGEVTFSSVPLTLLFQWRAEILGQTIWQSTVEQEIWDEVGEDRTNTYSLNYQIEITPPEATNAVGESHPFTVTVTEVGTGAPLEGVTVYLSTDFGSLSTSSVTTDSNGEATFSISSDEAGTAHITAWIDALGGTSATFDQGEVNDTASKSWQEYKKTFSLTVNPPIAGATYFVDYSTDGWQSSTTLPLSQVGQTNVFSGEVTFSSVPLTLLFQWRAEILGQTIWQSTAEQEIWDEVGEDRTNTYSLNYQIEITEDHPTNAVGDPHTFTVKAYEVGTLTPLVGVPIHLAIISGPGTIDPPNPTTTNTSGEATFTVRSDTAGTATIRAWIDALGGGAGGYDTGIVYGQVTLDEKKDEAQKSWVDLAIEKTDDIDPVELGDTFIYTIKVTVLGGTQHNVTVTDTIPAGLSYVSSNPAPTISADPVYTWNLGTKTAGTYQIEITVTADEVGTHTNLANVSSDEVPERNTDEDTTVVGKIYGYKFNDRNGNGTWEPFGIPEGGIEEPLSGWTITLIKDGWEVYRTAVTGEGDWPDGYYEFTDLGPGTYTVTEEDVSGWAHTTLDRKTITVSSGQDEIVDFGNQGQGTITGHKFVDLNGNGYMDGAADYYYTLGWEITIEGDASTGYFTDTTTTLDDGEWGESGVPAGTYTVTEETKAGWTATTPNPVYNVVVTAGGTTTVDFGNRQYTDVSVIKSDSPDPVSPGGTLTYTITVTNLGPSAAQNVTLSDTPPLGSPQYSTDGGLSWNPWLSPLALGNISYPGSKSVLIKGTVTTTMPIPTTLSNTVTVSSSTYDPDTSNNQDTEETAVLYADLSVAKTDSPDPVSLGGTLTYTLVVTNNGPSPAENVVVTEAYDSDFTFVSSVPAPSIGNNMWNLGTMAVDETRTITITGVVASPAKVMLSNAVNVSTTTYDSDVENNFDVEDTTVLGIITGTVFHDMNRNGIQDPGEPSLSGWTVTLFGSDGTTVLGTQLSAADGSYLFDDLPAGVYYVEETLLTIDWDLTTPPIRRMVTIVEADGKIYPTVVDFGNDIAVLPFTPTPRAELPRTGGNSDLGIYLGQMRAEIAGNHFWLMWLVMIGLLGFLLSVAGLELILANRRYRSSRPRGSREYA